MNFNIFLEIPKGWNELFTQMCEDISKVQNLDEIEFIQVKEKFGELRVYANNTNKEVDNIIKKYEYISKFICSECGKPAYYQTQGYILPYCIDCWKDFVRHKKVEKLTFNPILHVGNNIIDCSDIWDRYIGETDDK